MRWQWLGSCRNSLKCSVGCVGWQTCSAGYTVQAGCVTTAQVAQQIKQVAARGAASGSNIGIGVVAMNSFEDATSWLKVRTVLPFYTD